MTTVRAPSSQRGFSFFEVLIAALILGVAVLGFAALQVRALNTTGESHFRSQAAVLAADLSERIRMLAPIPDGRRAELEIERGLPGPPQAFPAAVAPIEISELLAMWAANTDIPTVPPATLVPGVETCIYDALNAAGCGRDPLIVSDIAEIRYLADELLPAGNIDVRECSAGSRMVCIFVAWRGQDATACNLGDINPDCFAMQVLF